MRQLVSSVLLAGLFAVSSTGCPKKYVSGTDTVTPAPAADTAEPAPAPEADAVTPPSAPETAVAVAEAPDAGPAP
ncbi:MAG: hypothetical protein EP329_13280, partial [Deltaproteobacteria bacterium]